MKKLSAVVLFVVVAVCGFFAWFSKKDQDELDEAEARLARGLMRSNMDPTFAHDVTADPVQTFRDKGAV